MRVELVFRVLGAIGLGIAGWYYGAELSTLSGEGTQLRYVLAIALAGFGIGLLITPYLTLHPILWLRDHIRKIPMQDLLAATLGLLIGLVMSALLAIPLSMLPSYFGRLLPFVASIVLAYLGIVTMVARKREVFALIGGRFGGSVGEGGDHRSSEQVVVDTSAIIDGRIADISQTGFIAGTLVIPRFVLNELQHIADSPDVLRRNRGRRGLDMLNRLQKESVVPINISEIEVNGVPDVDSKLVKLAKQLHCPIITNDFNLNRVAAIQGVRVLNINELANAVKSVVLPGEDMVVRIIQEGKEPGQGVAYLDDGTMIVVEAGRKYINNDVEVVVTRVLQTVAGRMIFAHPKD